MSVSLLTCYPQICFVWSFLGYVIEIASPDAGLWNDPELVEKATRLRKEISGGKEGEGNDSFFSNT